MHKTSILIGALAAAASLSAQVPNRLGFTAGWNTSYTDRLGGTQIDGDALNHYDERHYQDWMLDPADPTGSTYTLTGMRCVIQDQVANTAETFTAVGYNEDPLTTDMPDPAAPWFRTGNIAYPPMPAGYANPTGPIAWVMTVTVAPPATPKGDKWLGFGLPQNAAAAWPTDGLSVHATFDMASGNTGTNPLDQPGNSINFSTVQNFACFMQTAAGVPVPPAVYAPGGAGNLRQMDLDILAGVAGGVCVAQTNQTRYPASNAGGGNPLVPLGGTTNILSGTHPDVYDSLGSTPPRADDIGFLVNDVNLPNAVVLTTVAFGPSPAGSIPLTVLVPPANSPNTRGNVCVDFTTGALFVGFTDANGVHQFMMTLNAQARAQIQAASPMDIWYQSFILSPTATSPLEVHGTGCAIQHL